jgi:hypothetical protein
MEERSMNDLPPQPPPQAKPFEPEQIRGGGGCQKPMLVGCGLVALLIGIAAVVFVVKAKDVLAFAMNKLRAEVVAHLPADASENERQQLEAGFDAAMARIRTGAIEPASLQELQKKLTAVASTAGRRQMSREELADLIAALDRFNQAGKPAADGSPDEAVPDGAPRPSGADDGTRPPPP